MSHYKKAKNTLFIVLSLLAIILFSSAMLYAYFSEKNALLEGVDKQLLATAYSTNLFSQSYVHQVLQSPPSQDKYVHTVKMLSQTAWNSHVEYIYLLKKENNNITFLADSASVDEFNKGDYTPFGGIYSDASAGLHHTFQTLHPSYDTYSDKWGNHRSLFLPMMINNIPYVIGVDISLASIEERLHQLRNELIIFSFLVLSIGGIIAVILNKKSNQWLNLADSILNNLHHIIEIIPYPLYAKTLQGDIILQNKASKESSLADSFDDMSLIQKETTLFIEQEEQKIHDKTHFFQTTKLPFTWSLTSQKALLSCSVDITSLIESEQKLQKLNMSLNQQIQEGIQALRQKDDMLLKQSRFNAMGEVISAIAHHWRQPLNAISIIIQDINDAYKYDELSPEYLQQSMDNIVNITEKLSHTIEIFRSFYDDHNSHKVLCQLSICIQECIDLYQPLFDSSHIRIITSIQNEGEILGYTYNIKQTLLALLTNAHEVLLETKPSNPCITIELKETSTSFLITIEDNGGGVTTTDHSKIFDPYFSTKSVSSGSGMGLYLSRIYLAHMGATIALHNTIQGALFTLEFPKNSDFSC